MRWKSPSVRLYSVSRSIFSQAALDSLLLKSVKSADCSSLSSSGNRAAGDVAESGSGDGSEVTGEGLIGGTRVVAILARSTVADGAAAPKSFTASGCLIIL